MIIYVLILLGTMLLIRAYQIHQQTTNSKITSPTPIEYLSLVNEMVRLKLTTSPQATQQLQAQFMNFVVKLGTQSLQQGRGIGSFKLPHLKRTPVFVLSNRTAIQQLYTRDNEKKFGQQQFFTRLALILGSNNLMSSKLGSDTHKMIRQAILNRNEAFRPKVAQMVADFFQEYEQQTAQNSSLSEVMDKLSRRVLLSTYFGENVVQQFEELYNSNLTKQLIDSLFSLDPIKEEEKEELLMLRTTIFKLGCQLIYSSPALTTQLTQEQSWLNYLLTVRIIKDSKLKKELEQLGIMGTETLSAEQAQLLISCALKNTTNNLDEALNDSPLSQLVQDVVNESLFIPLLGFDATATVLITALRIAIQDKRIYSIIKNEMQQKTSSEEQFEVNSTWDNHHLSYAEAVLLEALRLAPPAPIVPEMMNETVNLQLDDFVLTLPKGALVFIPLESLHTHTAHFPNITLSQRGQQQLGKKVISAKDIFPERWGPKSSLGTVYNADFFEDEPQGLRPGALEKQGGLLSFKTGARRCPGLRIAITEILSLLRLLAIYEFELTDEEQLKLRFNYATPLQRNGGLGLLKISPASNVARLLATGDNSLPKTNLCQEEQEIHQQIGLKFFDETSESSPEQISEISDEATVHIMVLT